jgi:hypothetical protein
MSENENPILYVEELQRFPLRRRRETVPGTVIVYRRRNGALTMPKGGYTPAELVWYNPQLAYEIDLSRHAANVECEIGGERFDASLSWVVTDPVAVVTSRLTDPYRLAQDVVPRHLQAVEDVRAGLPLEIVLPEGITITVHYAFRLRGDAE